MRTVDQRASDADRDRVVELLRDAAHEGRISADELDGRVATALKAKTYRELDATIADLPDDSPGRGRRGTGRSLQPQRSRGRAVATWSYEVVRENPFLLVVAIPLVALTFSVLVAGAAMWLVLAAVVMVLGGEPRGRGRGRRTVAGGHHAHRYGQRPRSRWN